MRNEKAGRHVDVTRLNFVVIDSRYVFRMRIRTVAAAIGASALVALGVSAMSIAGANANSIGGAGDTVTPSQGPAASNVTYTSATVAGPTVTATFFGKS